MNKGELEEVQNEDNEEEKTPLSVIMEDAIVHDGEYPCGDPDCPCATLGYPV
jgi:hypothetical protein